MIMALLLVAALVIFAQSKRDRAVSSTPCSNVRASRIAAASMTFIVRVVTWSATRVAGARAGQPLDVVDSDVPRKSRGLWVLILALAILQLIVLYVFRKLPEGTRRQLVFTVIASLVFFEIAAFASARYLPILFLMQQPDG